MYHVSTYRPHRTFTLAAMATRRPWKRMTTYIRHVLSIVRCHHAQTPTAMYVRVHMYYRFQSFLKKEKARTGARFIDRMYP